MTQPETRPDAYTDADLHEGIIALRRRAGLPISDLVEAVLVAVAPAIAARTLREAAGALRDEYTCDPEQTPRDKDPECVAFDDAIKFLRATADEIEAGR